MIWKQQIGSSSFNSAFGAADDVDEDQKEQWIASHILMFVYCHDMVHVIMVRGSSMATIYDLSWSPDGNYIAAGSCLENITTIWDIATRVVLLLSSFVLFTKKLFIHFDTYMNAS